MIELLGLSLYLLVVVFSGFELISLVVPVYRTCEKRGLNYKYYQY